MESDQRSGILFGRIFCDEPVSTSSENALATVAVLAWRLAGFAHSPRKKSANRRSQLFQGERFGKRCQFVFVEARCPPELIAQP